MGLSSTGDVNGEACIKIVVIVQIRCGRFQRRLFLFWGAGSAGHVDCEARVEVVIRIHVVMRGGRAPPLRQVFVNVNVICDHR